MKTFLHFLENIGINMMFIVGALGAVMLSGKQKGMKWTEKIFTILGGGFTANYLTPLVQDMAGIPDKSIYAVAFVLGYSGLKTIEIIVRSFHEKLDKKQDAE